MNTRKVGILGGGQLGRMLAASASLLNIPVAILDVGSEGPAKQIISSSSHIDGAFTDPAKIQQLADSVDILTVEIEHVDVDALDYVQSRIPRLEIHPSPSTIRVVQDKFLQKEHLRKNGSPISDYVRVNSTASAIEEAATRLGLPLMLKSRTLAYDGRGNYVLRQLSDRDQAIEYLGGRPLYAEKWVPFDKEIAVMVVRSATGEVRSYPAVETVQKDNICHLVFAPLRSPQPDLAVRAQRIAEDAVKTLQGAGVFGVEMFLMKDGTIFVNEIAPRPHNSGHYTIEACESSQFSNHLRAILSLPLGSTELQVPSTVMLNLIGASSSMTDVTKVTDIALATPGASVHLYGKAECRKGRKMGHITIVGESDAQVRERLRPLLQALPDSSDSEVDLYAPPPPAPGRSHPYPLVSIIMGSDSDLHVLLPASRILAKFNIPHELTIVSAHRTPDRMVQFAKGAAGRGVRVIIAGAGGAAHLPGMVAAMTSVPVVGVPVRGTEMGGQDSVWSILQMPRGVPVATVAINNGMNAGLLAARILSAGIPRLHGVMDRYAQDMKEEVLGKVERLSEANWEEYEVKKH